MLSSHRFSSAPAIYKMFLTHCPLVNRFFCIRHPQSKTIFSLCACPVCTTSLSIQVKLQLLSSHSYWQRNRYSLLRYTDGSCPLTCLANVKTLNTVKHEEHFHFSRQTNQWWCLQANWGKFFFQLACYCILKRHHGSAKSGSFAFLLHLLLHSHRSRLSQVTRTKAWGSPDSNDL